MIGICNGFQVLVRAGLLPRLDSQQVQQATLTMNTSAKFECRWIHLETQESNCIFTQGLKLHIYLPVAHAEGRFTAPEPILDEIEDNGQVVFRYGSTNGGTPEYPDNPNGSDHHIAGICDPTGRIFGMMPHPERFLTRLNHPRWTREDLPEEGDGLAIFQNAVDYVSGLS
jgi:phosphoribosylformylglycinamidine synthase